MGGTVSLYDILKARKTGLSPDLYTLLRAQREMPERVITAEPPIYFKSDGTAISEYQISGDTVQNGTPTPDNPIEVLGVGDKTVNLFDKFAQYQVDRAVYTFTISGLVPQTKYVCSTNFNSTTNQVASVYFGGNNSHTNGVWADRPKIMTANEDGILLLLIRFQNNDGGIPIYDDLMSGTIWVQVERGITPTAYEPYGYKIPITLNSVTQNIYLDSPLYEGDYIKRNADGTGVLHQDGADTPITLPQLSTVKGSNELNINTTVTPEVTLKGKIKQLPDSDMDALLSVMEEM